MSWKGMWVGQPLTPLCFYWSKVKHVQNRKDDLWNMEIKGRDRGEELSQSECRRHRVWSKLEVCQRLGESHGQPCRWPCWSLVEVLWLCQCKWESVMSILVHSQTNPDGRPGCRCVDGLRCRTAWAPGQALPFTSSMIWNMAFYYFFIFIFCSLDFFFNFFTVIK